MGFYVVIAITLAFGSFLLSLTLIKDIKDFLKTINESSKSKRIMNKIAYFMDFGSKGNS